MDGATLAQCAQHLAMAGLYSPEISEEVARQLAGNPWSFNPADLQCDLAKVLGLGPEINRSMGFITSCQLNTQIWTGYRIC